MTMNWFFALQHKFFSKKRRGSKQSTLRLTFVTLFICLVSVPRAHAQISASIKGMVTDSSGAPVPSSSVNAKNIETGAIRSATTDEAGRYLVLSLPVGKYELSVSKPGFQEAVRSGVRLVVGQEASVDITLQVSTVKAEVRVNEDAPIVNTTTKDISGIVGEQQIRDLPLNGRSYDLLLPLNPGVVNFTWMKTRSEEHTSELQSRLHLVCRLLLEKKKKKPEHT